MKLTSAQWRLLAELSEPNRNPGGDWYFPQKNLRTLVCLARLGLARATDSDFNRYGYQITAAGKAALRAQEREANV